jgi:hypothetical protein
MLPLDIVEIILIRIVDSVLSKTSSDVEKRLLFAIIKSCSHKSDVAVKSYCIIVSILFNSNISLFASYEDILE